MTSSHSIEQSELWDIAQRLVSFNTVSNLTNVPAAEYLANFLEDLGFTVKIWREHIEDVEKATVLAWIGPQVEDGLIISGHTDIVPFEGQPGWKTDPLKLQRNGERIYGRGTSDMKSFLAQALFAVKHMNLKRLQRPLVFIFTCDEELAGQGSGRLVKVLPEFFQTCPLPKVAFIGEPTNFEIFPAHKGYATFDVDVYGKGGHSSAPHQGVNAIEKMAEVIHVIQAMNEDLKAHPSAENMRLFSEIPASVFNLGVIQGGLAPNMIADFCHLTASIRISPGDNIDGIMRELREKMSGIERSMKEHAPDCRIAVGNFSVVPPLSSPMDTTFCALLSRVMDKPVGKGAPYATDGGSFQQIGINSYICGPGALEEAHQPNESISVSNFFNGVEKLENIIYEWCVGDR